MSSSTITCLDCGQANSIHRLWCSKCGKQVPYRSRIPGLIEDQNDADRSRLYRRVLDDLERLLADGKVSRDAYDAIHAFYSCQIQQIDAKTAERDRARKLVQSVITGRHAAHDGRFEEAIELLSREVAEDRGEHQLEQAIAEIREKQQQRERSLQASRQADALYREATECILDLRLHEAEEKLERARRLDPSNRRISTELGRVKSQIADVRAQELARQTTSQETEEEILTAELVEDRQGPVDVPTAALVEQAAVERVAQPRPIAHGGASFADEGEEVPSPTQRLIDAASQWSSIVKPFLLDNVGWFVGAFLVVAGFVVLIVTFWGTIEQNRVLMHSLVYISLALATGAFFAVAYFMRLKYPQLESSSNVLLVIVALLVPLVFAAALLTSLIPAAVTDVTLFPNPG